MYSNYLGGMSLNLTFRDYISIKIHQTDLNLTKYIKSELEPFNLAPEQNLIMMLLWEKDGITQNELAQKLEKDKTNVARMVWSLEKKGFIERLGCPNDGRAVKLYLTPSGKELGRKAIPVSEAFDRTVCKGLSDDEIQTLRELLAKINRNVSRKI